MSKMWFMAAALAATGFAQAQPAASAAGGAKPQLVARVLQIMQPAFEGIARSLGEQPAAQLAQQLGPALQRLPAERRAALARDIDADLRKYVEEAVPIVREHALKLAPQTIGPLFQERFTEDELKQLIALLDSPVNRKFQSMFPEMQRALGEKLVADTRGEIEPKVKALQQSIERRLNAPAAAASAPGPKASAARK